MNTIPSINKTAFSCPHCNAYTTQQWSQVYLKQYSQDRRIPNIPNEEFREDIQNEKQISEEVRQHINTWINNMNIGKPFIDYHQDSEYLKSSLENVNVSQCYNCREISLWVHEQLIYPNTKIDIIPNQDLPIHIKNLFEEAREIVSFSPKGSSALLRLSIQYLCKELGESGENIDKDIGNLVKKGLNPLIQKALDIVRVIGNEAVHPGEINLDDNQGIAIELFNLVNLIADQMITQPKKVNELFDNLPKKKLLGIQNRDKI